MFTQIYSQYRPPTQKLWIQFTTSIKLAAPGGIYKVSS